MDSFEFNKIAGAVLATALGVMALSIISEIIYEPAEASQPGYVVATAEAPAAGGPTAGASGPVTPIAVRLTSADVANGETVSKKCLACHTLLKDQPAKVGPNLWGVLGGPAAHMSTFKYSDAMLKAKADGLTWTYDNLDKFLTAPKMFIDGTAMGFAGLPQPKDRADMIAYLRTLADSPFPLPTTASAAAGAPAPSGTATPAAPAAPAPAPAPAK
jgi:cytochrome c